MSEYILPFLESFKPNIAFTLHILILVAMYLFLIFGGILIIYVLVRIAQLKDPIKQESHDKTENNKFVSLFFSLFEARNASILNALITIPLMFIFLVFGGILFLYIFKFK